MTLTMWVKEKYMKKIDLKNVVLSEFEEGRFDEHFCEFVKSVSKFEAEFYESLDMTQKESFEKLIDLKVEEQDLLKEMLVEFCFEFFRTLFK